MSFNSPKQKLNQSLSSKQEPLLTESKDEEQKQSVKQPQV